MIPSTEMDLDCKGSVSISDYRAVIKVGAFRSSNYVESGGALFQIEERVDVLRWSFKTAMPEIRIADVRRHCFDPKIKNNS